MWNTALVIADAGNQKEHPWSGNSLLDDRIVHRHGDVSNSIAAVLSHISS